MPDYEYKARLMREGLVDLVKQVKVSQYYAYTHKEPKSTVFPLHTANLIDEGLKQERYLDYTECEKILHASFQRGTRLYHRVESILFSSESLFLTLTFTDETLASTCADTRKQYVRRYLKSLGAPYVANIDYGGKNGREHYHAIVGVPSVDYKLWHEYGAIKGEKIVVRADKGRSLGKYISKLSNHAIKATARCCKVIYSR